METKKQWFRLCRNWKSFIRKSKSHVRNFVYYSAEVDLTQIDPKKDPN